MLHKLEKVAILFVTGGFIYILVELLWRGYSHWSMFLMGGLCFVLIGLINEISPWAIPIWKQGFLASLIITIAELAAGYVLNIYLGWALWDYSDMPLNFMGQICPFFSAAWFFVGLAAVFVDDWIRYMLFHEEWPDYDW